MSNKECLNAFTQSLISWGGAGAKIYSQPNYLTRLISPINTVSDIHPPPQYRSKPDAWKQIAPVINAFTNAYIIQELDLLFDGPSDLLWAVDTMDSQSATLFLLAFIIVARENASEVICEWKHPMLPSLSRTQLAHLFHTSILIKIRQPVADAKPDFFLTLTTTSTTAPEIETGTPERIPVKRYAVVECDRQLNQPRSNDALESDIFMQERGYPVFQFSEADVLRDCFACAVKVFRCLAQSEVVTDEL